MIENDVIYINMMTNDDLKRIMGDTLTTENKINSVMMVCKNATSDWAKNYWFRVWQKLCVKYDRMDLYRANLH